MPLSKTNLRKRRPTLVQYVGLLGMRMFSFYVMDAMFPTILIVSV